MKKYRLRQLLFMAMCCDLGLFAKKLIAPAANLLTDFLHIPGGVGTSFSLMFLVVTAALVGRFGCAALMGAVQSAIAVSVGMVGSMGMLAPIGYVVPGLAIDITLWLFRRHERGSARGVTAASALASLCACLTANLIAFRLRGLALALYACVSLTSGVACGLPAIALVNRLMPVIGENVRKEVHLS